MNKIKFAIVGCGHIGKRHAKLVAKNPYAELTALVDIKDAAEPGIEFTLILWPKAKEGPCLRVLPPQEMAELMRDIDAMPNSDPNKVVLKRFIGSESVQVAVDKGGRICVPEEMAKAAGIKEKGEAVLVGLLDRFEIWNPERYDKVRASDAIMAQEAFKLME